jgi:predicted nucleic acid-binding protein
LPATVLDSFALIAYFRGEPGGIPVKALLQKASAADKPVHMTEVNYAEVKDTVLRKDGAAAWNEAAKTLIALPIEFHPVDRGLADLAADFAAALAKHRNAELVTGDPEFKAVDGEIKIGWLK